MNRPMITWQQRAAEALAHNIADVFERGPGLRWTRKTAAIAIDRTNKRVLKTGLGIHGIGTMWCPYENESPDWADLPEQDSTGQFGTPEHADKLAEMWREIGAQRRCSWVQRGQDAHWQMCRLGRDHDGDHDFGEEQQ